MKRITMLALAAALLFALTACSAKADKGGQTATDPPTSAPPTTAPATAPPEATVSEQDIKVKATPVLLTERPEFEAKNRVREEELVSLHGYSIGMTFAETQQIWEIPREMVRYAAQRIESGELSTLYIYVGNMAYGFGPGRGGAADYDSYVLQRIYYGETVFCETIEALSVLRGIKVGDMIEDALKSLPGNRTPKKWAIDQLYGEKGKPNSASLEYTTNLGFYELRIYCENSWISLTFGNSGKLMIAEVYAIN